MIKNNHKFYRFLLAGLVLGLAGGLLAMSWPLKPGKGVKKLLLTSTFGESRVTHFHDGLDLAALNAPVYPLKDGQILFHHFAVDNPHGTTMGPGNFVLVLHPDEKVSSYFHLAHRRPLWASPRVEAEGSILGYVSDTGHSAGPHLHFNMLGRHARSSVNLLAKLPNLADPNGPEIQSLHLFQTVRRQMIHIAMGDKIPVARDYPLAVAIRDPGREKNTRRGIYWLAAWQNGKKLFERTFQETRFEPGQGWVLGEGDKWVHFDDVFLGRYYRLTGANLVQGENKIRVECRDRAGNQARREFTFYIDRVD